MKSPKTLLLVVSSALAAQIAGGSMLDRVPRAHLLTWSKLAEMKEAELDRRPAAWRRSMLDSTMPRWVGNSAIPLEALVVLGNLSGSDADYLHDRLLQQDSAEQALASMESLRVVCGFAVPDDVGSLFHGDISAMLAAAIAATNDSMASTFWAGLGALPGSEMRSTTLSVVEAEAFRGSLADVQE